MFHWAIVGSKFNKYIFNLYKERKCICQCNLLWDKFNITYQLPHANKKHKTILPLTQLWRKETWKGKEHFGGQKKSPSTESIKGLFQGNGRWATYWKLGTISADPPGISCREWVCLNSVHSRGQVRKRQALSRLGSPDIAFLCIFFCPEGLPQFDLQTRSSSFKVQHEYHLLQEAIPKFPHLTRCPFSLFLFVPSSPHRCLSLGCYWHLGWDSSPLKNQVGPSHAWQEIWHLWLPLPKYLK